MALVLESSVFSVDDEQLKEEFCSTLSLGLFQSRGTVDTRCSSPIGNPSSHPSSRRQAGPDAWGLVLPLLFVSAAPAAVGLRETLPEAENKPSPIDRETVP